MSPFFSSRWVEVPEWVREDAAGGLPAGFRAAGVAAGIKPSGGTDVGLLVSDAPETTSAARFTRSGVLAAPVLVTRERARLDALRVVVANSGNANAATGGRGHGRRGQDAGRRGDGRRRAGRPGRRRLDRRHRRAARHAGASSAACARASSELRPDGDADFAAAIMTTDAFEKRATPRGRAAGGTVRLCAQAKGAGMISPALRDDAVLRADRRARCRPRPPTCCSACASSARSIASRSTASSRPTTRRSSCARAPAASRVEPESEDELRFGEALDALLRQLALRDRARRRGRPAHRPRRRARRPRRQRRGGRARGGQLAAGQGRAARRRPQLGAHRPGRRDGAARHRAAGGRHRDRGRAGVRARRRRSPSTPRRWRRPWRATRSSTWSSCPASGHETEVFFSDLGHEYVTINAEYTT